MEFAKNVPKPKRKVERGNSDNKNENGENRDLGFIEEEAFDENGVTLAENDLAQMNFKHEQYANELEKIKQSLF